MSSSVNVRSIDALGDFRGALFRFRADASDALSHIDYVLGRTREWLQERSHYWQREVRRQSEEVRNAEFSLGRCRSSGGFDAGGVYRVPDCERFEHAVKMAQNRLRAAEAGLLTIAQWQQSVERAMDAYQREALRLRDLFDENLPVAAGVLESKLATLAGYISIAPPSEAGRPLPAPTQFAFVDVNHRHADPEIPAEDHTEQGTT
jgi:hypothetical protein